MVEKQYPKTVSKSRRGIRLCGVGQCVARKQQLAARSEVEGIAAFEFASDTVIPGDALEDRNIFQCTACNFPGNIELFPEELRPEKPVPQLVQRNVGDHLRIEQPGDERRNDAFPAVWLSFEEHGALARVCVGADVTDELQEELPLAGVSVQRGFAEPMEVRTDGILFVLQIAGMDYIGEAELWAVVQKLTRLQVQKPIFKVHQRSAAVEGIKGTSDLLRPGKTFNGLPDISDIQFGCGLIAAKIDEVLI